MIVQFFEPIQVVLGLDDSFLLFVGSCATYRYLEYTFIVFPLGCFQCPFHEWQHQATFFFREAQRQPQRSVAVGLCDTGVRHG